VIIKLEFSKFKLVAMKIFSFDPISDRNAIVLILGTMPGVKSLKINQYYGHGGNSFWKLIFSVYDKPFSASYDEKKKTLLENKIALWDVLKACEREGSSDKSILLEESNDFVKFFHEHSNIQLIAFNGGNAEMLFYKYSLQRPKVKFITLPSTSPANTWKNFEEKLVEWKQIRINK
jgi:hypoxanthine-DNA glycosylase